MCCHAAIEESEGCVEYVILCSSSHHTHTHSHKMHTHWNNTNTTTNKGTLDVTAWNTREWNARVASRLQIFSDFVDEITNLDSDGEIGVVTRMELLESLSRKGDSSSESLTRNVFVRFFERRMNDLDMMRAEDEEGGGGGIILN